MKLATKIYGMSAALICAMFALTLAVNSRMNQTAQDAESIRVSRVPQELRVSELELNVTRASLLLRHAILARTPQEQETALEDAANKAKFVDEKLVEFGLAIDTLDGRAAFAPLPFKMRDFQDKVHNTVALIKTGDKAAAFADLADRLVPARNALLEPLALEKHRQAIKLDESLKAVAAAASTTTNAVLIATALMALGLIGFSLYIAKVLSQLGAEPAELKEVATAIAGGNLSLRIELKPGDKSSVMAAFKTMSQRLSETVRVVLGNAESVSTASAQIAAGSADLSARTEHQGATLQETASAMQEVDSAAHQNAQGAQQACELALSSSSVAAKSGKTVEAMVLNMQEISEASKHVAEFVSVIDAIAFQSNLLALNAAVEAAHAGERGKGFGVVAAEVRALSRRSAQAARDIKETIKASVERTSHGAKLALEAGDAMQDVVRATQQVADTISEISAASAEQRLSVAQVSSAVAHMDSAVQQNAALVEQSTAAAHSLKQQASQLVAAVSVFKI